MQSDLQLVYMIPKISIQLLNINKSPPEYNPEPETTTKFQVNREPVYSFTNMIPVMDDT